MVRAGHHQRLDHLNIAKTGGTALEWALRPSGRLFRHGHAATLRDMADAIVIVRDPVSRFRSAWDFHGADDLEAALGDDRYAFRPQSWWLVDAETARQRCAYIARTETLDEDFPHILALLGLSPADYRLPRRGERRRNESPHRTTFSSSALALIRARYAADYSLLSEVPLGYQGHRRYR